MSFSKILHKRSLSAGSIPTPQAIDVGEIVLNAADGKLFTKTSTGSVKHFSNDSDQAYTLDKTLSSSYFTRGSNSVTGVFSTVVNGVGNQVTGAGSTIANGEQCVNEADYSFIGSGVENTAGSAADFGAILAGQNNSLLHQNSFIFGSNITSHAEDFTYVQNLSVIGNLYVGGSNVNGGGGGTSDWTQITNKPTTLSGYGILDAAPLALNTFINSNSADWANTRTTVNSNSAKWENVYTNVNSNSSIWNDVKTTVNTNSAIWGSGGTTNVNTNSAKWETAYTNVNSNSAKWDNTYTNVNSNSANWNSTRTTVNSNSGKWENVYTSVNSNSGTYATKSFVQTNFLPLTGGLVTNGLSAEHLIALSSFAAIGFGSVDDSPTLYVGVSVVGVNTENPNAALTVVGDISATGNIYGGNASWDNTTTTVNSNSGSWNSVYTNVNSNSADWANTRTTVNSNSAKWENVYTNVNSNSADWANARTTVNSNSANWNGVYTSYSTASSSYVTMTYVGSNLLFLTGGNITGNVSAVKFYGDGSELTGIVAGDTEATTLVRSNSANWDGVYTSYNQASSSYATSQYTHANFLPLSGGIITGSLTGANILLTGTLEISSSNNPTTLFVSTSSRVGVNTETPNHALTVNGNISATGALYANDLAVNYAEGATATLYIENQNVGINTENPLATLDVSGNNIRISETKTPASSGAVGAQGEICWDADYLYVCVATDTWKRVALQSW